jgi:hypothetical protein
MPHDLNMGEPFMAITVAEYNLWRTLAEKKSLPAKPDVLELGEANWYGDVPLNRLIEDIPRFTSPDVAAQLTAALNAFRREDPRRHLFDVAKIFYKTFLDYQSLTAIDLHGTSAALKYNLNDVVPIEKRFHITINTGTAEHVFNQYQMFKTIHDLTLPGGVMFHTFPFVGWLDHGFYNYNPTLIMDLAMTNDYAIIAWIYAKLSPPHIVEIERIEQLHDMAKRGELAPNSVQLVAFTKPKETRPFVAPMQGFYFGKLSAKAREDWYKMRIRG